MILLADIITSLVVAGSGVAIIVDGCHKNSNAEKIVTIGFGASLVALGLFVRLTGRKNSNAPTENKKP